LDLWGAEPTEKGWEREGEKQRRGEGRESEWKEMKRGEGR